MSLILKQESSANVPTPPAGKGTLFLNASDQVVVKDSAGNTSTFPTVSASGNTQVFYNDAGSLTGDASFTFNKTNDTVTIANLTVTGTLSAGDISVSSIANGNSNVDIIGTGGNVTVSVGGNANVLTVTGTDVIASGNITAANANLGNVVTGNYFTGVLTYAAQPNITSVGTLTSLYVGATSSNVDFANAKAIASQDNVGNSAADNIGLVGEGVANGTNSAITGIGLLGHARVANATKATGVQGQAFVTNTADTGAAVGIRGYSVDTHSGGYNIGILGNAMGSGVGNYAFYIQNGGIASIENATFWDLTDNSNAALTFSSTGKANIFGIETTDNAEGIFTSGYLNVVGNISAAGIKTNNYYYANGNPVDFQQAAGSNTQLQFNNANDFGASANLTFDTATNLLNVTGTANVTTLNASSTIGATGNVTGGNIVTGGQVNAVGNVTAAYFIGNGSQLTGIDATAIQNGTANVKTFLNANVAISSNGNANVVVVTGAGANVTGTLDVTGNITAGNVSASVGAFTANSSANNFNATTHVTAGNVYANSGTVGATTGTFTGNVSAGNLNATTAVVASTLTSNVSTGTSPLTVTSTTRVANLNVSYANVSDFGVVTAQSTGAYYPIFVNGSSTANYALAANSGFSANLANGGLTATTFIGNLDGNVLGALANGTSSLSIPASGGNVNISAAGNANVFTVTGTGANVTGTLNATGNLTTGGVLTVSGTGVSSIAGNLDMTSNNIINLATPVNSTDAATKQYVDDVAQGLHTHDSCNAATDGTLATISGGTVTYDNGTSGVGATLTTTGSYTTIDGVTLSNGMRILVKNEANSAHNGIYDRTSSTVLTRSSDFDTPTEMAGGDFTFVTAGTLYDNTGWVMTDPVTTVGTSPVPWVQFSGAGTYTAGTGLTLTGSQFSITNTAVSAASYGNGDRVASFTVNAQGQLTAASNTVITANAANLTGTTLASSIVTSSLTTVGTLGTLNVSGNANVGNIGAAAGVFTTVSGNGSALTDLNASNISSGTLAQARLANASLTVNGQSISLGGSGTITANTTQTLTFGSYLTGTSFNGGTANTIAVDATSANTASKVVARDSSGNFSAGTITATLSGAATTAGTVTTAAQPNITSVGTLSSLAVTGNITAGNLSVSTGTVTLGTLTTGGNTTAGTVTGNWTLSAGSRWNATYADLAEKYVADADYEPGTVLVFGGEQEVTIANDFDSTRVAGVVTTNPAFSMNNECIGDHVAEIALQGRVPCKVAGTVQKGDLMVSGSNGHAVANNMARAGTIIGKALQNFTGTTGVIEVAVGRF
jgi:hypothetical protein